MEYPLYVDAVIRRLEDAGEQAYIVGGGLRDMLIGNAPHDYDVTTSALPEKTLAIFSDMRVIETGIAHGTVTVLSDSQPVEVTTFRIDGEYTDSRHPDSVSFTRSIEEDLSRRDFTVNAMAYSKTRGLVDLFGGRQDIEAKILRAVGSPEKRFSEDALRIMRLFRFSAQLGFEIEPQTLMGARNTASRLVGVARERIASELLRLICSPSPSRPLTLMKQIGVFEYIFDSFCPTDSAIEAMESLPTDEAARLAALLWGTEPDKAEQLLRSLRLSNKLIAGALATLRGARAEISDALSARRLIANTGIYAPLAASLSVAMGISKSGAQETVCKQLGTPSKVSDLKINGKILSEMGASGKMIGQTLNSLLSLVVESPELNEEGALRSLAKSMLDGANAKKED